MFEEAVARVVGAAGVKAPAVASPRHAVVDLVFDRVAWVVVTQFAHLRARAGVGGCPMPSLGSAGFADTLDRAAPSPELATLLEELDPGDLHDAALIEAVAGWDRIVSWATARQAGVLRELTARRTLTRTEKFTGDEIAARLGCTRFVAENAIGLATALGDLPRVDEALTAGVIDPRKAGALTGTLAHLPLSVISDLSDTVLPAAGALTVPALIARLRRLELARDPGAATKRAARARRDRHVHLTPSTDAMAWLSALLPADDASTIFTAIDAIAASSDPADPRTIDQRRADALTDLASTVLDTGLTPAGLRPTPTGENDPTPTSVATGNPSTGETETCGDDAGRAGRGGRELRREHRRRPHLQITIAATTLLGVDNLPGDLAGYGPIPADIARRIATHATWQGLYTDPETGELTRLGTRTYPPGTVYEPAPEPDGSRGSGDLDRLEPTDAPESPARAGDLARHEDRYRPGAALTALIIARDQTCTFLGCRQPAWRCDLDHITPGDPDRPIPDQTTPLGLHCLCRHHHLLKTHAGWTVTRDPATGHTTWITPTGHTYLRPATAIGGALNSNTDSSSIGGALNSNTDSSSIGARVTANSAGAAANSAGSAANSSSRPDEARRRNPPRPSTPVNPPVPPLTIWLPLRPTEDDEPPF